MKYFTVAMLLISTLCFAQEKSFDLPQGMLDIKNTSGKVDVTGTVGTTLKVSYTKVKWDKGCSLILEKKGGKVIVSVDEPDSGWFSKSADCNVNFQIVMPKKVKLNVESGSGDISIDGLESNCDFKAGSGDVAIMNSVIDKLNGKFNSGEVSIKGQFKKINLETRSGRASITLEKIIGKVSLALIMGCRSITVLVPKATKVKARLEASGGGQLKNNVGNSDDAVVDIDAITACGDLKIRNI